VESVEPDHLGMVRLSSGYLHHLRYFSTHQTSAISNQYTRYLTIGWPSPLVNRFSGFRTILTNRYIYE